MNRTDTLTPWQRERMEAPIEDTARDPLVLGCPMPAWCAGVLVGVPVCGVVLCFLGVFQ